jgi:hypothetical protein
MAERSQEESHESPGFGMTELEEALRAPGGAAVARDLLRRFIMLDEQIKSQIASGLSPDMFAKATVIINSLAAARDVLLRIPKGP